MRVVQFTPAPRKALPCIRREGHTIYSEGGIVVANTGTHSAGSDELANARLIAAAPDMFNVLKLLLATAWDDLSGMHDVCDAAVAALDKVRAASADTHAERCDVEQAQPARAGSAVPKADAQ